MAVQVSSFITVDEGEFELPLSFRESDFSRIHASVLVGQPSGYQNFRMYSPRGFFGYFQFFAGESVEKLVTLEYSSQVVYTRFVDHGSAMEDRCRKYVCLAQKLDWLGKAFSLTNPTVIAALGPYPLSSDASGFGDLFFSGSPSSLSWKYDQGVSVLVELVWYEKDFSPCNLGTLELPTPDGCRQVGQPVPALGTCIPTTPSGGGGS